MILQRAGDNLGCRRRTTVDQHHQRLAVDEITLLREVGCVVLTVSVPDRDDFAVIEEGVGHSDRLAQVAAGVVAQVEDVADQLHVRFGGFLVELGQFLLEAFPGGPEEAVDADVADIAIVDDGPD